MLEGDMGVYGIAVLGFFSCGISVILILTCGISVSSPCGMRYFIILADGIRGNMIVHGIAVRLIALSFRYNTQNKTQ